MDIINSYDESSPQKNLLYLAKPVYGGWVTFTAHLSHKLNAPIYKIAGRNETFDRDYGYECKYRNQSIGEIIKLDNILITAVDKHYWEYLHLFPPETEIIIHDPTECKKSRSLNPLVQSTDHNEKPLLEVHLLEGGQDLYDRPIRVHFIDRIRDEKKFNSKDDLRSQIIKDVEIAKSQLSELD